MTSNSEDIEVAAHSFKDANDDNSVLTHVSDSDSDGGSRDASRLQASRRSSRRLVFVAIFAAVIGLSVGLGLGETFRGENSTRSVALTSDISEDQGSSSTDLRNSSPTVPTVAINVPTKEADLEVDLEVEEDEEEHGQKSQYFSNYEEEEDSQLESPQIDFEEQEEQPEQEMFNFNEEEEDEFEDEEEIQEELSLKHDFPVGHGDGEAPKREIPPFSDFKEEPESSSVNQLEEVEEEDEEEVEEPQLQIPEEGTQSPPAFSFGGIGSIENISWPELVGLPGEQAKKILEDLDEGYTVVIVPPEGATTKDLRTDRIFLFVNEAGHVARVPRPGR